MTHRITSRPRAEMKRRAAFLLFSLVAGMLGGLVVPVQAGRAPDPVCWFSADASTLYASGLPTNDTFSVTYSPYPAGTHLTTTDGTFSTATDRTAPLTAYFWERGGGKSLMKVGAQLNDYHLIATCSA